MTDQATPSTAPQQIVVVQQTNSIGMAGFIVSLVGVVGTCGALAPIGFVLSLFGLTRSPKGFAIAGTVIGGLGTLFFAFIGLGIILLALGIGAFSAAFVERAQVYVQFSKASDRIESQMLAQGALPDNTAGQLLIADIKDKWGQTLRYQAIGSDSYVIASSGADMQFDTEDDLSTSDVMYGDGTFDSTEWEEFDWDSVESDDNGG